MRKITAALLTTAAAGAAVALTAGTASAATLTVTNPNSSGAYTASSTSVKLTDGSVNMTCTGSAGAGVIKSATYSVPPTANIGTISSLNFTNCTGPLGAVTTTVSGLPYNVFIAAGGTTPTGYIGSANVHVSMPLCSFDVTGNAPGKYVNGTSNQLQLGPSVALPSGVTPLTVSNVSGCAGLVHNGDHPSYTANYTVSPNITVS